MTEKKNYCVDGKCTADTGDYACKYYEPCCCSEDCESCVFFDFSSDNDECRSESANADYQESQK